jgi:hypothetical protein
VSIFTNILYFESFIDGAAFKMRSPVLIYTTFSALDAFLTLLPDDDLLAGSGVYILSDSSSSLSSFLSSSP